MQTMQIMQTMQAMQKMQKMQVMQKMQKMQVMQVMQKMQKMQKMQVMQIMQTLKGEKFSTVNQLSCFYRINRKKIMKENVIKDKSFELAVEIVFIYQHLIREKHEYILSKQVLRSGTSVGANISEGVVAQSKKEFCNRLSIAYKESHETGFWLKLLLTTGYLTNEKAFAAIEKCDEVIRILYSILRTSSQPKYE